VTLLLALIALAHSPAPAADTAPPEPYSTAVQLVEELYLEPGAVTAPAMLRAAAHALEHEIPWLVVHHAGAGVVLQHGGGPVLGNVEATTMAELPYALYAIEHAVSDSGYPIDDLDPGLVVLAGIADALDRYSRILADEKLDRFTVRLSGTLVGIGAEFDHVQDRMRVVEVTPGGPAELGGLLVGDEILRIDGRSTVSMPPSEATRRTRGQEGTQVQLTLRRGAEEIAATLHRAEIVVPNVDHRVLEGGVGYVFVDHVSQRTVENLEKALAALRNAGALDHGLVMDLRGNTGGSMKEAARAADLFLTKGVLLRTEGKDGGAVQNLQGEMVARVDGTEPEVPLVVLVDERTASGAEIMAGAFVELGRGALVGSRTYGKGTVQKIYTLDDDVRFKLTVARYILANDRGISAGGIEPDVALGQVTLDRFGVRLTGFDRVDVDGDHDPVVVPEVDEQPGWRGAPSADVDLALELARRAVLDAEGTSREAVLAALRHHAAIVNLEQSQLLAEAFADRKIDWSLATDPVVPSPELVLADVKLTAQAIDRDLVEVKAEVTNRDPAALEQVLIEVDCASMPYWDDLVIPVGRVGPGVTVTGTAKVPMMPGIDPREDEVDIHLRATGRPLLAVGQEILASRSTASPTVRVRASLLPATDDRGPHDAPVRRANLVVQNLSGTPLTGVEVHFGFPGSEAIELIDYAARAGEIGARSEATVDLAMEVGPKAPDLLPLELLVEDGRFGALADWSLPLPADGSLVVLQPPTIEIRTRQTSREVLPTSEQAGPLELPLLIRDDRAIDHVLVWVNGEKVAWAPGEGSLQDLKPTITLLPGDNRIVVTARDDQGLTGRRSFSIRGVVMQAAVASPEDVSGADPASAD
jgi:carboxyl-terminal processing protease